MSIQALAGRNDAVDTLIQHRLDMPLTEAAVVLDITEKYRDAVVHQRLGNARHQRQGEAAVGVVGEQADGETAVSKQALSQRIGPKAQARRRRLDIEARLIL